MARDAWRFLVMWLVLVGCKGDESTDRITKLESRMRELESANDRYNERLNGLAKQSELALVRPADPKPPDGVEWFCPLEAGPAGIEARYCIPVQPANTTHLYNVGVDEVARLCNRDAKQVGTTCVRTRFVVCTTQDADPRSNVCFARWAACEAQVKAYVKARRCVAYFDGKPLEDR